MGNRTAFYYDNRRNLTAVLDPDNGLTYYGYDKANRMTSVLNPWGETAYYEYTPDSQVGKRVLGNGCVTYFGYDPKGQVSLVENLKSDLSVISTFEYTRDRTGNPLSILREDGSCVYYEYDLNQQLTKETQTDDEGSVVYAWEWDYDRAGNRTWQQLNGVDTYYEYNAGNELTVEITDGVATYYEFDRNGNQTVKDGPDGTTLFHYDFENLLRQIDLPDGAHNYFTYDADSKRVSAADSGGYTRFVYQGPDMLKLMQERDEEGDLKAQYTMGQGLESMRRGEASSFYHYDALGSTAELTGEAEAVTDTYRYNAWGEVLARTGTTVNPHAYVGRERYYLAADGTMHLLGLRYYVSTIGRFIGCDPIDDARSRYVYSANWPTMSVDPAGLQPCRGIAQAPGAVAQSIAAGLWPGPVDPGCLAAIGGQVIPLFRARINDKYKHCLVGCILSGACGLGAAMGAGALKEMIDWIVRQFGIDWHPDALDLIATDAGAFRPPLPLKYDEIIACGLTVGYFRPYTCEEWCGILGYTPKGGESRSSNRAS